LTGHRRGKAESDHALDEGAAVHAAILHLVDHRLQFIVQHGCPSLIGLVAARHRAARTCAGKHGTSNGPVVNFLHAGCQRRLIAAWADRPLQRPLLRQARRKTYG
jgi:hypothetical protein